MKEGERFKNNPLRDSQRRVESLVQEYYKSERENINKISNFDVIQSRFEAVNRAFLSEVEHIFTDPRSNSDAMDQKQVTALLSDQPVDDISGSTRWSDVLARICQQFRLTPQQSDEILRKYFPFHPSYRERAHD